KNIFNFLFVAKTNFIHLSIARWLRRHPTHFSLFTLVDIGREVVYMQSDVGFSMKSGSHCCKSEIPIPLFKAPPKTPKTKSPLKLNNRGLVLNWHRPESTLSPLRPLFPLLFASRQNHRHQKR